MFNIDLQSSQIHKDLRKIQNISTPSDITILYGALGEECQDLFLPAEPSSSMPTEAHTTSREESSFLPKYSRSKNDASTTDIIAWGSYTKTWIGYALCVWVARQPKISLDSAADDVFNHFTPDSTTKVRLPGNPTLKKLLCHINGFAPMNEFLFAPDQTFMLTRKEFLEIAPEFTRAYYDKGKNYWTDYSNANYIFIGILLEVAMKKPLQDILQELVFGTLDLSGTAIDLKSVDGFDHATRLLKGFQISSQGKRFEVNPKNLLRDTTESASMGIRSSLDDIYTFNMKLLQGRHPESGSAIAGEDSINLFSGKDRSFVGFVSHPLEGKFECETPTVHLYPKDYTPKGLGKQNLANDERAHYTDIKKRSKGQGETVVCGVTQKAGYIDGSSCNVIFFEESKAFPSYPRKFDRCL